MRRFSVFPLTCFVILLCWACARTGGDGPQQSTGHAGHADTADAGDLVSAYRARTDSLDFEKSLFRKYITASENVDFFAPRGMELEAGRNLDALGNVMAQLADTARALEYYDRAEQCIRKADARNLLYENMIHRTNVLPKSESEPVFRSLLADSFVKSIPELHFSALHGAYFCTDSLPLLDSCIALLDNHPSIKNRDLATLIASCAGEYITAGEPEEALKLIPRLRTEILRTSPIAQHREFIHTIMAQTYYGVGSKDSCINELLQVIWWTDSAYREANLPDIYANETRKLIEYAESKAALERRELALWLALAMSVLAIAGLAAYFVVRRRNENARREIEELDNRLESVVHSHMAQTAVMDEYKGLVAEMRGVAERHLQADDDASGMAREILSILNVHESHSGNREGFLTVSRKLDPQFSAKLKSDFPALSEGQLRLGALIAAGVDNRQLCSILNISSKSLYTARYRLRTQLGLSKSDSLEDLLRKYTN